MDIFSSITMHLRGALPTISLYVASPLAIRDKYCTIPAVKSCSMEMAKEILAFPGCAASQAQTRLSCLGSILWATPCDQACSGEMSTLNASFMILQSLHKLISPQYTSKHTATADRCVFVLTSRSRCFYRSSVWRTKMKSLAPVCCLSPLLVDGISAKIDKNRAYIMNEGQKKQCFIL